MKPYIYTLLILFVLAAALHIAGFQIRRVDGSPMEILDYVIVSLLTIGCACSTVLAVQAIRGKS